MKENGAEKSPVKKDRFTKAIVYLVAFHFSPNSLPLDGTSANPSSFRFNFLVNVEFIFLFHLSICHMF